MSTPKSIIIAAIVIAISTVISTKLYVDSQPRYTFFDEGIAVSQDGTMYVKCPSSQKWYRNYDDKSFDKLP